MVELWHLKRGESWDLGSFKDVEPIAKQKKKVFPLLTFISHPPFILLLILVIHPPNPLVLSLLLHSVSNGISVWWNLLTEDVPGWLCLSAFQMRSRALRFDGITCGSAHLEIGPALSDANRTNQPSTHRARTCLWKGRTLTSQTWLRRTVLVVHVTVKL